MNSAASDVNHVFDVNRYASITEPTPYVRNAQSVGPAVVLSSGFDKFQIPEMPSYVQSYTKRGEGFGGQTAATRSYTRFGNPRYVGGMDAFVSQLEDGEYFEPVKVKKGNMGVFEHTRWAPGFNSVDGMAGISASRNFAGIQTRGGSGRAGGPRRGDYAEMMDFEMKIRPGQAVSREMQSDNNYAGLYEYKKQTPEIETESDFAILREMIEHNPFHISSHGAAQAKEQYDRELGQVEQMGKKAYDDHIDYQGGSDFRAIIGETNQWWQAQI